MPFPDKNEGNRIVLRFGGGMNTRSPEWEIDPQECADGSYNFGLKLRSSEFTRRAAFDLVATAPNGQSIDGYAQLVKSDGTITTLIQAGTTIYSWDGASTFTVVGTVNSGSRMRGTPASTWTLNNVSIITDLEELTPVKKWDGTTFSTLAHNLGGDFYARYCLVQNSRAVYANVRSASTSTPHVIAASKVEDYQNLDVTNKPSSALAVDAAFYLVTPDLLPCNGIIDAFGLMAFSTRKGRFFKLTGTTSKDYAIAQLYPDSGAVADEAITYIGNDIAYGRNGRIETLFATQTLGDVATDDLSFHIAPTVDTIDDWVLTYNPRFQKLYCFSNTSQAVYVFHKDFLDDRIRAVVDRKSQPQLSPWAPWKTDHSMNFQPASVFTIKRPTDGLDVTYMGGSDGKIYQLEGSGGTDGGTTSISVLRISKQFASNQKTGVGETFKMSGYLAARKVAAQTVTTTILWGGKDLIDVSTTTNLLNPSGGAFFGGSFYFGGLIYFGVPYSGRAAHYPLENLTGEGSTFQVKTSYSGSVDVTLKEYALDLEVLSGATTGA